MSEAAYMPDYIWRADLGANEWKCGCLQYQDGFEKCADHTISHSFPTTYIEGEKKAVSQIPVKEIRITDPKTGGEKGMKATQMSTIDTLSMAEVGKVGGFGAKKYARYNYLKGYAWSLSYDALQRHLQAWWAREDNDPESGLSHLAHAAWHCLALLSFSIRGLGTDDRLPVK